MKPAAFDYYRPERISEAVQLLEVHADRDARVVAGGQSLVPLMNLRLAQPEVLVDLAGIDGMVHVGSSNGALRIGAMTRQQVLLEDPEVGSACPLLRQAAEFVGHVQIRNRGTVGGALAHADPAAEYPAVAVAVDASFEVHGPSGERRIPVDEFFRGPFTTALDQADILTAVHLPCWASTSCFMEVARRHGDFAIAAVAVALQVDDGRIARAGIGLAGVGGTPLRAVTSEQLLTGEAPTDVLLERAAEAAATEARPSDDIHGSAEFRRNLARVLTLKSLQSALQRS